MTINITNDQKTIIIDGRIDTLTSPTLEEKCLPLISKENPSLTFNCTQVSYISSSGLRVFILASKAAHQFGGHIKISGLNDFLRDIFSISGLMDWFEFE